MIDIINYDDSNIFSKILRKEIPSDIVFEDKNVLAFKDINPQAPIHILIIPKSKYCSFSDFSLKASSEEIEAFFRAINDITEKLKIYDGYRLISNVGAFGGQEVPHFHFHLLSGKALGSKIT
jgi:diadenosine tetraphosphate (Ap4A) HIT family hydrolase